MFNAKVFVAELIGTFALVFIGAGAAISGFGGLVGVALAHGFVIATFVYAYAHISGAHFNPAVSLVMWLRREIDARRLAGDLIVQLVAGIAGIWAAHLMFDQAILQLSTKPRSGTGQWAGEFVATFGLILTIIGTVRHRPQWVPATVALYIAAAYWFTSSTSFANPAITIARSLSDSFAGIAPADVAGFILAQLAGALCAVGVARLLFDGDPS